jgi:two-component system, NarL family, response regulator DevR
MHYACHLPHSGKSSVKAFIVEDSHVIRERLCSMISSIGNIELAGAAESEADAVRDICALRPDLVILDLSLNGGTGLEVLHRVKLQDFPVTVIVLTNFAYPQYREKCMALGADYFLDKSLEIEMLAELLQVLAEAQPCQAVNHSNS